VDYEWNVRNLRDRACGPFSNTYRWADFFVVAARTGGSGMNGISLLLLEKDMPGLAVRKVVCQGNGCAGTAYVTMENVKVPVKNIIGKLNKGFMVCFSLLPQL
jgi:alkylation response protein AidB-like acyl-CoA dehydrogenase